MDYPIQHKTGICYNCEGDEGIHQFETMKCPKNGREENHFNNLTGKHTPQIWMETTFEDKGELEFTNLARNNYYKLIEALGNVIDTIPEQTNDADWWPDELTRSVTKAEKLLESLEVKSKAHTE